jgi:hypothetical protein
MLGPNDVELYTEDHVARHLLSLSKPIEAIAESLPTLNGNTVTSERDKAASGSTTTEVDGDVSMGDTAEQATENGDTVTSKASAPQKKPLPDGPKQEPDDTPMQNGDNVPEASADVIGEAQASKDTETDLSRQEAQTADESIALEGPESTFVHPMYLTPANSRVDRDAGLPEQEAEHLRKLLALYVQKQEEVCRGAHKLHEGLLKAQRLRADVLHWSKAEAHSGPNRDMSDGEDWYDKEEWGLTEDLKKGQDEEEEDTTTTGKKTTRARR